MPQKEERHYSQRDLRMISGYTLKDVNFAECLRRAMRSCWPHLHSDYRS